MDNGAEKYPCNQPAQPIEAKLNQTEAKFLTTQKRRHRRPLKTMMPAFFHTIFFWFLSCDKRLGCCSTPFWWSTPPEKRITKEQVRAYLCTVMIRYGTL